MRSLQVSEKASKSMFLISGTKLFSFLIFSILLLFLFALLTAAAAENNTNPVPLSSNDSTVLQIDGVYTFQQGYEVVMQRFSSGNVLIEVFFNDTNESAPYLIGNATLAEGETVQCYRQTRNSTDIVFMMTLDKIYLNPEMAAEFSHIYQYNDSGADIYPLVPNWIIHTGTFDPPHQNNSNNTPDPKSDNSSNESDDEENNGPTLFIEPVYIISVILVIAAVAVFLNLLNKQNMKNKKSNKKSKK